MMLSDNNQIVEEEIVCIVYLMFPLQKLSKLVWQMQAEPQTSAFRLVSTDDRSKGINH